MSSSLSLNVILAKVKSKFGKRLKEDDYQALLSCNTVAQVAAYLKNNTSYGDVLAGVNENTIHRAQLEALLQQKNYNDLNTLCKYEISVGDHFVDYLICRVSIGLVLSKLLSLATEVGVNDVSFFKNSVAELAQKHSKINLNALATATSYQEVVDSLAGSEFSPILEKHKPQDGSHINYAEIGSALYYRSFQKAFYIADNFCSGSCREELYNLFGCLMDLHNYTRIVRMKKNYNCESQYIKTMLLPKGNIQNSQLEAMINAPTANDATAVFKQTSTGKKVADLEYSYVDEIATIYKYQICKQYMRFSLNSPVVLISYIFLMEVELMNVTHIIEGIRYNLDKESIAKLIVND